jgi:hypothetical protein
MPYGFYQLVRFTALIGFTILAYQAGEQQQKAEMFIYLALALLFQPLLKVSLGREIWNVIDVIVGTSLMITIFWKRK